MTDLKRFRSSMMQRVSLSSSVSLETRKPVSKVERTSAILKKAMTEKQSKLPRKAGRQSKDQWSNSSTRQDAHSSQDAWKSASSNARWKEITNEVETQQRMIQEKKTTWSKSLKESAKREADILKALEAATEGEKVEDNDRGVLEETLR